MQRIWTLCLGDATQQHAQEYLHSVLDIIPLAQSCTPLIYANKSLQTIYVSQIFYIHTRYNISQMQYKG